MNLSCQGIVVLTAGELADLGRLVDVRSQTLTAMSLGDPAVTPEQAYACLDVECGLAANGDETVHQLLDRGLDRLERAFPSLTRSAA